MLLSRLGRRHLAIRASAGGGARWAYKGNPGTRPRRRQLLKPSPHRISPSRWHSRAIGRWASLGERGYMGEPLCRLPERIRCHKADPGGCTGSLRLHHAAAWGPDGAVCVRHTRLKEPLDCRGTRAAMSSACREYWREMRCTVVSDTNPSRSERARSTIKS